MISIALFPCLFTDGARVVGELSYTFGNPVMTDELLIHELSKENEYTASEIRTHLFGPPTGKMSQEIIKAELVSQVTRHLATLLQDSTDWLYYGFFTILLDSAKHNLRKILITADYECRQRNAERQESLTREKALDKIKEHDQTASYWTQYITGSSPYSPRLYDTVIEYQCQDLLDVIASIFMLYETGDKQPELQLQPETLTQISLQPDK